MRFRLGCWWLGMRWDFENWKDRRKLQTARSLPGWLKYWVVIAVGAEMIERNEEVPAVPFMAVLERAGRKFNDN